MPAVYRNGRLGVRPLPHARTGLSIKIVSIGVENFYTTHGFLYPLTSQGPNLPSILEDRALYDPKFRVQPSAAWLVVDRHGELWQADVYVSDDPEGYKIDVHSLPTGQGVSWALADREWDREIMASILISDIPEDQLIAQFGEQGVDDGWPFVFMDVAAIAKRIQELFPEEPTYSGKEGNRFIGVMKKALS